MLDNLISSMSNEIIVVIFNNDANGLRTFTSIKWVNNLAKSHYCLGRLLLFQKCKNTTKIHEEYFVF